MCILSWLHVYFGRMLQFRFSDITDVHLVD